MANQQLIAISFENWFIAKGLETLHAKDLPNKSQTKDGEIADFADKESSAVISKDRDFFKVV